MLILLHQNIELFMKKLTIDEKKQNVIHFVERIDDKYGGPAKSIPYTAWVSSSKSTKHIIVSGSLNNYDKNSVCEKLGVEYYQYRSMGPNKISFSPKAFFQIFYLIFMKKNIVIHLHNAWNAFPLYIWFLRIFFDFKIIISARGAFFDWSLQQGRIRKKIAWIIFQKNLLKKSNIIHVTSIQEERALHNLGIRKNITLIPNGIQYANNLKDEENPRFVRFDSNVLKILFISRIHPKKGLDILLNSLMSNKISYKIELCIAGEFASKSYEQHIKSIIKSINKKVTINLLGHVDAETTSSLYASADIFILPSHSENFGIVVAEALSHGLPVITTIYTPWSEIEDFSAGYIIDCNTDQLIMALNKFQESDSTKKLRMSAQAKALIKKYDWVSLKKQYEEMYELVT